MGVSIPKDENTGLITLERVCDLSRKELVFK